MDDAAKKAFLRITAKEIVFSIHKTLRDANKEIGVFFMVDLLDVAMMVTASIATWYYKVAFLDNDKDIDWDEFVSEVVDGLQDNLAGAKKALDQTEAERNSPFDDYFNELFKEGDNG